MLSHLPAKKLPPLLHLPLNDLALIPTQWVLTIITTTPIATIPTPIPIIIRITMVVIIRKTTRTIAIRIRMTISTLAIEKRINYYCYYRKRELAIPLLRYLFITTSIIPALPAA